MAIKTVYIWDGQTPIPNDIKFNSQRAIIYNQLNSKWYVSVGSLLEEQEGTGFSSGGELIEEPPVLMVWGDITGSIEDQTDLIDTIKNSINNVRVFLFDEIENVLVEDTNYISLLNLSTSTIPEGTYSLSFNIIWGMDTIMHSAEFRYSIDGGLSWNPIMLEAKDISDINVLNFTKPLELIEGHYSFLLEARVETSSTTLKISEANILLERKL